MPDGRFPMSEIALTTRRLGRTFGTGDRAVRALEGLELEVRRGEVFGLLGHNGAGKTTTVRLLNGVLKPTTGSATVLGLDPQVDGPALRERSGVLTETPALDERLEARETLALFGRIFGLGARAAADRAAALLRDFGLEDRADEPVAAFSKGMKQRLALARTLVHEPELIFLDEPTEGLDPVAAREVHELVRTMTRQQGRTVVLCTHNLVEAQRLCDRVAVLQRGAMVALGTPAELARRLQRGRRVRFTVAVERAAEALAALRAAVGGDAAIDLHAGEDAGTLHLDGAGPEGVAAAVAALVAAEVPVHAVVPQEPSLEDAYFALVERPAEGTVAP